MTFSCLKNKYPRHNTLNQFIECLSYIRPCPALPCCHRQINQWISIICIYTLNLSLHNVSVQSSPCTASVGINVTETKGRRRLGDSLLDDGVEGLHAGFDVIVHVAVQ